MENWWKNRKILVTGHTGFKGAWLCLWLGLRGAKVTTASLPSDTTPNLYDLCEPWKNQDHHIMDIRNYDALHDLFVQSQPEIVFHLAGQALVRRSYKEPVETYATNLMGTVHVMEAIRKISSVKAALMITTDKVYENHEKGKAFIETDRLGGRDPYSSSKACAELAVQAYRESFFNQNSAACITTARAGNVVGGGDWSEDRLIPDIVRAYETQCPLVIRNPKSIRPWQHVLDALNGYMIYARIMVENPKSTPLSLNFGPLASEFLTVEEVVRVFSSAFGQDIPQKLEHSLQPHEAGILMLDTRLAQDSLGWSPFLCVSDAIEWTAQWYKNFKETGDARSVTIEQIQKFETLAPALRKDAA